MFAPIGLIQTTIKIKNKIQYSMKNKIKNKQDERTYLLKTMALDTTS